MSVVTATILSDGKELDPVYRLISIDVNREVNRIPYAQLVLIDGDAALRKFPLSDEVFFEPGKEIEIKLRYEGEQGQDATVFKGLVVRHGLESDGIESILRLEMKDPAYGLTLARKSAVHKGTDDAIIKDLISKSGLKLKVGKAPATKPDHLEFVQYYCTDWDFMLSRAEANNLVIKIQDGEITLQKLEVKGSANHTFEYGISEIYRFHMDADASHQYAKVQGQAWDSKKNTLSKAVSAPPYSLGQSNLKGDDIAKTIGGKEMMLTSAVPLDPEEVKSWAASRLARSRMSLLRGSISVPGFAEIELLEVMEIVGLGKRFQGQTLVTGIRHQVDEQGWQTHIQFGMPAEPFSQSPDILDAPAAGLLPAVHGLQIGIVDKFEEDPDKQFRIRVLIPGINAKEGIVWARITMPEAGKERGQLFLPEKGDEVVIGFFNDDPRQAVILGSLYSITNKPPKDWEKWTEENIHKGIVTKSGIKLTIDDKDKILTLLTSEKQSITMDETSKSIVILDVNENKITLDDKGIAIEVADKLSIKAKGDIEIEGNNVKLVASANLNLEGNAVEIIGSSVDIK